MGHRLSRRCSGGRSPTSAVHVSVAVHTDVATAPPLQSVATLSPHRWTVNPQNWTVPVVVTLSAVADDIWRPTLTYRLSHTLHSNDTQYTGQHLAEIRASVSDDDTAAVLLSRDSLDLTVQTNDAGGVISGDSKSYGVSLGSQPLADVTLSLQWWTAGSDFAAGSAFSPSSLLFSASNWNTTQTVTVSSASAAPAPQRPLLHLLHSSDPAYHSPLPPNFPPPVTAAAIAATTLPGLQRSLLVFKQLLVVRQELPPPLPTYAAPRNVSTLQRGSQAFRFAWQPPARPSRPPYPPPLSHYLVQYTTDLNSWHAPTTAVVPAVGAGHRRSFSWGGGSGGGGDSSGHAIGNSSSGSSIGGDGGNASLALPLNTTAVASSRWILLSNLTFGDTYAVRVRAVDAQQRSGADSVSLRLWLTLPPGPPSLGRLVRQPDHTSVEVSWAAHRQWSGARLVRFTVQYSASLSFLAAHPSTGQLSVLRDTTSVLVPGLSRFPYFFRVSATNAAEETGEWSAVSPPVTDECEAGQFLADNRPPLTNHLCTDCPTGARCDTAGMRWRHLVALSGWWTDGSERDEFYRCPLPHSCLGGNASSGVRSRCNKGLGFSAALCGVCIDGRQQTQTAGNGSSSSDSNSNLLSGSNLTTATAAAGGVAREEVGGASVLYVRSSVSCVRCWSTHLTNLVSVLAALLYPAGLVLLVSDTSASGDATILFRIFCNYAIVVTTLGDFKAHGPALFRRWLSIASAPAQGLSLDWWPLLCSLERAGVGTLQRTVAFIFLPFAVFCVMMLALPWLLRRRRRAHASDTRGNAVTCAVFLLFFFHSPILTVVLQAFHCSDPVADGARLLLSDLSLRCYTPEHSTTLLFCALAFLILALLFPATLLVLLRPRPALASLRAQPRFHRLYGLLYDGYRPHTSWWEALGLLRKVAIGALSVFASEDGFLQAFSSSLVVMAALCLHLWARPYALPQLNNLEAAALATVYLTQVVSILYFRYPQWGTQVTLALLAVNGLMLCGFIAEALSIAKRARDQQRQLELRREGKGGGHHDGEEGKNGQQQQSGTAGAGEQGCLSQQKPAATIDVAATAVRPRAASAAAAAVAPAPAPAVLPSFAAVRPSAATAAAAASVPWPSPSPSVVQSRAPEAVATAATARATPAAAIAAGASGRRGSGTQGAPPLPQQRPLNEQPAASSPSVVVLSPPTTTVAAAVVFPSPPRKPQPPQQQQRRLSRRSRHQQQRAAAAAAATASRGTAAVTTPTAAATAVGNAAASTTTRRLHHRQISGKGGRGSSHRHHHHASSSGKRHTTKRQQRSSVSRAAQQQLARVGEEEGKAAAAAAAAAPGVADNADSNSRGVTVQS